MPYKSFYDHAWAKKIDKITLGTPVEQLFFDLCMSWKSAARTHELPWLLVEQLRHYHEGFVSAHSPFGLKVVNALPARIARDPEVNLPPDKLFEIQKAVKRLSTEIQLKLAEERKPFDEKRVWEKYLNISEFTLAILGSQRLVYSAVYFAYEDFFRRCYEVLPDAQPFWFNTKKFTAAIDAHPAYGKALREDCWTRMEIHEARLIRHAVAHNGGRLTTEIKDGLADGTLVMTLPVEGEDIQIMPEYTRALHDILKERVQRIVVATVATLATRGA